MEEDEAALEVAGGAVFVDSREAEDEAEAVETVLEPLRRAVVEDWRAGVVLEVVAVSVLVDGGVFEVVVEEVLEEAERVVAVGD